MKIKLKRSKTRIANACLSACLLLFPPGLSAQQGKIAGAVPPQEATLVPRPASLEKSDGAFRFNRNTVLAIADESQRPIAENFAALFNRSAGFTPAVQTGQEGDVVFIPDSTLKAEAYELKVAPRQITIRAADNRGYFYALQSLRLMLPPALEGQATADAAWAVPAVTLTDEPRFGYRGYMLDVARYFLPKEDVMRMIDCIALLKINRLHLHLSDDNGWRLEIKKYPRLTEVGAWRVDRPGKKDLTIKTDGRKARYVRFTLETPGNCPPDHVRPGQPSRIYIDEAIIR